MARNERHEENLKRISSSDKFKSHVGKFFTAELYGGNKVVGVLIKIDPDGTLLFKGNHMSWGIDPRDVRNYFAKPDRMRGGYNNP